MRPRRSFPIAGVVGLGIAIGLAATFVIASPRVTGHSPAAAAAAVSSLSPVTITFNQPMDAASVVAHLSISPATVGDFATGGSGEVVRFVPRSAWPASATVFISLTAGARSARGLPLLAARTWQFTVGAPRIAYLAGVGGLANVWAIPVAGGQAAQITHAPHGVLDFAPSPDGTRLSYAAGREDGGGDLRVVNADGSGDAELLACPGEVCRAPQWAPGASRIAFERRPLLSGAAGPARTGEPHLWLLDMASGAATAVLPDAHTTVAPHWSPDGTRLAYYDSTDQKIEVNTMSEGLTTLIADTSGDMGAWSFDGLALIFPDIAFTADASAAAATPRPTATPSSDAALPAGMPEFHSHLIRVEIATRARKELSAEPLVEDAAAAPSPDGGWIAFGRKYLDAARWTPGRQVWLMRPDGSSPRALTADGNYQHSAFLWSPDSRRLVYMRFDLTSPGAATEIWIMNADGSAARMLVDGGYLPAWLP